MAYTWTDTNAYITGFLEREGAAPNVQFLRVLANQALRIISRRARVYPQVWTNDGLAGATSIVLTSATVAIPEDCYAVDRVEWDGPENEVPFKSLSWLDRHLPGWREDTGDPDYHTRDSGSLILSSIPSAPTTSKLVIRGMGRLPDFSDVPGATNPLAYLPTDHQLLPAEYVLKEVPVDPENPVAVLRRTDAERRWAEGLAELVAASARRTGEPFRF